MSASNPAAPLVHGTGYSLDVGASFGRYQIVEPLARGGMAELFLAAAKGLATSKLVVLKKILPTLAADPQFRDMFLQEVELASRLDHPNIVTVLDSGVVDGEYYFAMEYVHGVDLREFMRSEQGALPLEISLPILSGIALALAYAHEAVDEAGRPLGLVHRDVSLTNVLLSYDGAVKLADFGIARASQRTSVTRTGIRKGKIAYMSPEQAQGAPVDGRSDLFSLGVIAHEIVTGKRLFRGASDVAVLHALTLGEIASPVEVEGSVPADLNALVMHALTRDVDARIESATAFQRRLDEIARNHGVSLSPAALADRLRARFGAPVLPSLAGIETAPVELPTRPVGSAAPPIPYGWIAVVSALVGSLAMVAYDAATRGATGPGPQAGVETSVEATGAPQGPLEPAVVAAPPPADGNSAATDAPPQSQASHVREEAEPDEAEAQVESDAQHDPPLPPEVEENPNEQPAPKKKKKKKKHKQPKATQPVTTGPKAPDVLYPPD